MAYQVWNNNFARPAGPPKGYPWKKAVQIADEMEAKYGFPYSVVPLTA